MKPDEILPFAQMSSHEMDGRRGFVVLCMPVDCPIQRRDTVGLDLQGGSVAGCVVSKDEENWWRGCGLAYGFELDNHDVTRRRVLWCFDDGGDQVREAGGAGKFGRESVVGHGVAASGLNARTECRRLVARAEGTRTSGHDRSQQARRLSARPKAWADNDRYP